MGIKENHTNEAHGAIGLLSELKLQKNTNNSRHFLTPKLLFRYAPGQMRQEENGSKLDPTSAFSMNKANNTNNAISNANKMLIAVLIGRFRFSWFSS